MSVKPRKVSKTTEIPKEEPQHTGGPPVVAVTTADINPREDPTLFAKISAKLLEIYGNAPKGKKWVLRELADLIGYTETQTAIAWHMLATDQKVPIGLEKP